jgi:hypothetical protein
MRIKVKGICNDNPDLRKAMKTAICCFIFTVIFGCASTYQNDYINPYTIEEIYSKFSVPSDSLEIQGKYVMKAYGWRDYQLLELGENKFHWEYSGGCMVPADTTHVNGTYYRIEDTLKFVIEESFIIKGLDKTREKVEIDSTWYMTLWSTKELQIRTYDKHICLLDFRSIGLIHHFLGIDQNVTIDEIIADMLPENRRTISTFYSKLKNK